VNRLHSEWIQTDEDGSASSRSHLPHYFLVSHLWFVDVVLDKLDLPGVPTTQGFPGRYERRKNSS